MINGIFTIHSVKNRAYVFGATTYAFNQLLNLKEVKNKFPGQPIALMALPEQWFAMANEPALWLLSNDSSFPVYTLGPQVNLSWQKCYLDKPFSKESSINIRETANGFHLTSSNAHLLTFDEKKSSEVFIAIPDTIKKEQPIVAMWDYEQGSFKIVKNYAKA